MAAIKDYDWPELFKKYRASNLTQRQWCLENEMNETNTAREFAAIRRAKADKQIERARLLLAGAAPLAAQSLRQHVQNEDGNIAVKASNSVLGAVGLSAQVAAIQVNNKVDVQVLAMPIFADPYSEQLNSFLAKDATPESDS